MNLELVGNNSNLKKTLKKTFTSHFKNVHFLHILVSGHKHSKMYKAARRMQGQLIP